ncbi:MAG: ATP-dependent DNA helicase RecG [Candidatus Rokubacteria bacterium]|nr:ATP-dependent DNA helicase RecG [Candidatus Rokubacteria bacterium]MBI3824811.1 ATP-dependent DNA helicase RecG [Candidatus Rokubacteria bacterium]
MGPSETTKSYSTPAHGGQTSPGLATPLRFLKGVGPRRAELLAKKGLETVADALLFVPLRHEDRTRLTPLRSLVPGQAQTCSAEIVGLSPPPPGRPRVPFSVMLRDASGYGTASWFKGGYLARVLKRGQRLILHGKVTRYKGTVQLQHPEFEIVEGDDDEQLHAGRLVPVYSSTEGLAQRPLRALMWTLVETFARGVPDVLPEAVRARRRLVPLAEALLGAHFPPSEAALVAARRRLAFDDFLLLQLGLAILRSRTARERGIAMAPPGDLVAQLRASLPYTLTGAQERVWGEIRRDMAAPDPMQRLLQGDVGSGKTVVAGLAVLTAIEAGYQAAVMAPTEILAEQHYMTFRQILGPLGVSVTLLTSSLKGRDRAARRGAVATGEHACVVGTHALVQEAVEFRRLGLVVVDEQHRFGVAQRARLRAKGEHPDLLVMTATPIPRTLALTLYGDLDVSVLDELPPGRRPIRTVARTESKRREIYAFLKDQIREGRQAYVVYPLVEESEAVDLKAATDMARHLQAEVFADLTVGLMHGRLAFEEKDAIMRRFKAGEIHVLVSTTVIEVGIDVPNASVMLIEHAERFGLSQLHQLRGRVGRGPWKSYAILLHAPHPSEEARRRIDVMVETNDGFRVAEVDLQLRGPGDFFGTRQSGLPEFRSADLLRDAAVLEEARQEAQAIVAADPELLAAPHRGLRRELLERWRGKLALATAG